MKRVKKMPTFNVILFDFNTQKVMYYNIFPDIIDEWEKEEITNLINSINNSVNNPKEEKKEEK